MPINLNAEAGMFEPINYEGSRRVAKAAGITVVRGSFMNIDPSTTPDTYRTVPIADGDRFGPYVFAREAGVAGNPRISVLTKGRVYAIADGNIEPGARVMPSGATAGRVITHAIVGADPSPDLKRVIGVARGHPGEDSGDATLVTAGQLVLVDFPQI